MIFKLMLKGLRTGKARFACAVAGVAVAVGTLVFMTSLVATNDAQAPLAAQKGCAPWAAWRMEGVQVGIRRGPAPARGSSLKFLGQHGTMTAVGVAAGLPVGALVGWLFTFRTGAVWPGLPHGFAIPWRVTAEGALGALAFALVFAVPTALALVRRATRRQ